MIEKIFFGLAAVLVVEGLMLALMPNRIKRALEIIEKTSSSTLSRLGLVLMAVGIFFLSVIEI